MTNRPIEAGALSHTPSVTVPAPEQAPEPDAAASAAGEPSPEPELPPTLRARPAPEPAPEPPRATLRTALGRVLAEVGAPRLGAVELADGKICDVVPVDIKRTELELRFDVQGQRVAARALVDFDQESAGAPVLHLGPDPARVRVDGRPLPAEEYRVYQFVDEGPGDHLTPVVAATNGADAYDGPRHRVIERRLTAGRHRLEVSYPLDHGTLDELQRSKSIGATRGGMKFFLRMWDIDQGGRAHFLDAYAPANLEVDAHPLKVRLQFDGATREHAVITNGQLRRLPGDAEGYEVEFPASFNASMPYLHVTDPADLRQHQEVFVSRSGRKIPILVYSDRSNYTTAEDLNADHRAAMAEIRRTMAEMEEKIGPYLYDRFIARLRPELPGRGAGMEYAGATEATLGAVRHELIHSWWGRGVMPANGAAGWLDEALTSWMSGDAPQIERYHQFSGFWQNNLKDTSPLERGSSSKGYGTGVHLVQDLDLCLREAGVAEGLMPVLRDFYAAHKGTAVTAETFFAAVRAAAPAAAGEMLDQLVATYGYPLAEADAHGPGCPDCAMRAPEG